MDITTETPNGSDSSPDTVLDAPADSSPAQVETQTESTAVGDRAKFMQRLEKAGVVKDAKTEDSPPAETETESEASAEPNQDEPEQAQVKQTDSNVLSQRETSFDQRPEWQGLKKAVGDKWPEAKKALRGLFERETQLSNQVNGLKESEAVVQRLKASTGDETGFTNALNLIDQYANDPAGSVPMLELLLKDARNRAGLEISSADLKESASDIDQQLDDGLITREQAERQKKLIYEAERARAEATQAKGKVKATEQAEAQRQTEALLQKRITSLNAWEANITKRDPDFPKIKDLFIDRATMLVESATQKAGRLLTPEEMVAQADIAYQAVKKQLAGLLPKKQTSRALNGDRSSLTSQAESSDPREKFHQTLEANLKRFS